MNKTEKKWAALLAILGLLFTGYVTGYINPGAENYLFKVTDDGNGPPPPPPSGWQGGTFSLITAGRDTLDSSGSLTVGTDFTGNWYAYRNGLWVFLGAGSASGVNIESDPTDDGYIWMFLEEISTKYWYSDIGQSLSKNTYMTDYQWIDVDGDATKEFAIKCSLWYIPEPASGYASRTYYPYFLKASCQGTDASALTVLTSPSDITVTANPETEYIGWETALSAEKRTVGIRKIVLNFNDTDTTKWELEKVNVPGVGYLDGSLFTEAKIGTTATEYTYIIGTDFDDIVYWSVPQGTANKFDCTASIKWKLDDGEAVTVTPYWYQWMYDRDSVSDNDAVVVDNAA